MPSEGMVSMIPGQGNHAYPRGLVRQGVLYLESDLERPVCQGRGRDRSITCKSLAWVVLVWPCRPEDLISDHVLSQVGV